MTKQQVQNINLGSDNQQTIQNPIPKKPKHIEKIWDMIQKLINK